MKAYIIILYLIGFVVLRALGDAVFDGDKIWGHAIKAAFIGYAVMGAFICKIERRKWAWYLAALVCWHIVGFDYLYSLFAGLPWNYIGTTSLWDQIISTVLPSGLIFGRVIFLAAAVFIPIRELNS